MNAEMAPAKNVNPIEWATSLSVMVLSRVSAEVENNVTNSGRMMKRISKLAAITNPEGKGNFFTLFQVYPANFPEGSQHGRPEQGL